MGRRVASELTATTARKPARFKKARNIFVALLYIFAPFRNFEFNKILLSAASLKLIVILIPLQDYDIRLRFTLPSDFSSWSDNAITLNYVTESTDQNMSKVDLYLFEENSKTVDAKKLDLVSAEPVQWNKTTITADGINQCVKAGDTCVLIIRGYSSNDHYIRVGDIQLTYRRDL